MVILTGNPGGTDIVTNYIIFIIIYLIPTIYECNAARMPYVNIVKKNINIRNFDDYFWKIFYCYLGNFIILIKLPLFVEKFVLWTQTGIPWVSRYF